LILFLRQIREGIQTSTGIFQVIEIVVFCFNRKFFSQLECTGGPANARKNSKSSASQLDKQGKHFTWSIIKK